MIFLNNRERVSSVKSDGFGSIITRPGEGLGVFQSLSRYFGGLIQDSKSAVLTINDTYTREKVTLKKGDTPVVIDEYYSFVE